MDKNNVALNNSEWRYGPVAKTLHWLIALLVLTLITLGLYMVSIQDEPGSDWYFKLHKSIGLLTAIIILIRIIWRLGHRPASFPTSMPQWQVIAAYTSHALLYLCLILMPLTGIIGSMFGGHGLAFFGLPLPIWTQKNTPIASFFFSTHIVIAWIFITLIVIHIMGAFKHLLFDRDRVFQRMWFTDID